MRLASSDWDGNLAFQVEGDQVRGRALIGEARKRVQWVFARMLPGQTFKGQTFKLSDDVVIKVAVWDEQLSDLKPSSLFIDPVLGEPRAERLSSKRAWATIIVGAVSEEPTTVPVIVRSGLACISNYLPGGPGQTIPPDLEEKIYWFNALERQDETTWTRTGFEGRTDFDQAFVNEVPSDVWTPFPASFVSNYPSMFTGRMRYVAQLLAGSAREINYSHTSAKTHGIFTNSITGEPWVIELAADGVWAWRLPIFTPPMEGFTFFYDFDLEAHIPINYLPRYFSGTRPEAAQWIPRSGLDIAVVMAKSSFSSATGWAFSDSGHEAQNVVFSEEVLGGETYDVAQRIKFTFSADADGNPASVAITEEDRGYAWYNNLQQNLRYPVMLACGPASVRYFPWSKSHVRPVTGSFSFPFYVFYVGDVAQVYTYTNGEPEETEHDDNPYPGGAEWWHKAYNGTWWTGRSTTTHTVSVSGPSANFSRTTTVDNFSTKTVQYENGDFPYATGDTITYDPAVVVLDMVYLRKDIFVNAVDSQQEQFSVVIPFGSREALYIYQRDLDEDEADSLSWVQTIVGNSTHGAAPASFWDDNAIPDYVAKPAGSYSGCCEDGTPDPDPSPPAATADYAPGSFLSLYDPTIEIIPVPQFWPGGACFDCGYWRCYPRVTLPGFTPTTSGSESDYATTSEDSNASLVVFGASHSITFHDDPVTGDLLDGNDSCLGGSPFYAMLISDVFSSRAIYRDDLDPTVEDLGTIGGDSYGVSGGLPSRLLNSAFYGVPYADE